MFKISVLRQKSVILCATGAAANLRVLPIKISALRQKLVTIYATGSGANLRVSPFKIRVFTSKLIILFVPLLQEQIYAFLRLKTVLYVKN